MESKNGMDYAQNYDLIVKWLAEAFRGQTLEAIGVKTGRIEAVFGFEPVDISVKAGRVDILVRDETGMIYHLEEQRNLKESDLYRFATYHFPAAKQWGSRIQDIILASGKVYAGEKAIVTGSARYEPIVIDFSQRDGRKRLAEIRQAVQEGTFDNWLELVFLPLYGKETGAVRSEMVESLIRFETELFKQERISSVLLAATLIMSNKLIDKERIQELWEEIKMLDVLEVAREKGMEEGREKGIKEGRKEGSVETARKMLLTALFERFGVIPSRITERINGIEKANILDDLFRQVFRCEDLDGFEKILDRVE